MIAVPADPQLPRGADPVGPTGHEPALPGDPAAFDPIWSQVAGLLDGDDDPHLWFTAVKQLLIPILRENRLATREEPVRVLLVKRPLAPAGAPVKSSHWYFNPRARAGGECRALSADQRLAVGTQLGAAVELEIPARSAAGGEPTLSLHCKRYGYPPGLETRHRAVRRPDGAWEIGPGSAVYPCD